jgi:hypothetical protein
MEASITIWAATSSGVVKRPVAKPPGSGDDRLASGVGLDAGGLSDRRGHAVFAEPKLGDNGPGREAVDADAARPELLGQALAQIDERGFGSPVVDHSASG